MIIIVLHMYILYELMQVCGSPVFKSYDGEQILNELNTRHS